MYWFVFEKGLKSGGVNTSAGIMVPFVLWLIAGIVPWFFFSDSISNATNSFVEYSYLVKKVVFKISKFNQKGKHNLNIRQAILKSDF